LLGALCRQGQKDARCGSNGKFDAGSEPLTG
jgi:hypothetical protein